jgi:hypothetical protein
MEVLGQLCRLAGPRLAHHNHHGIVADDVQQLLTDRVDGQVLPLLFQRLGERELGFAPLLVHLHVVGEAGVLTVVGVVLCVSGLTVIRLKTFKILVTEKNCKKTPHNNLSY